MGRKSKDLKRRERLARAQQADRRNLAMVEGFAIVILGAVAVGLVFLIRAGEDASALGVIAVALLGLLWAVHASRGARRRGNREQGPGDADRS